VSEIKGWEVEWAKLLAGMGSACRELAERYPAVRNGHVACYRSTENPRHHYRIYSYNENLTVTLIHGDDSSLPGVNTFGQPAEQLIACDCGKWEWPTEENIARTRERTERTGAKRRGN